jgi:hypothetical protein
VKQTAGSNKLAVATCNSDADCPDVAKCCPLNPECAVEHGSVCQRPFVTPATTASLPSIPFNLTITERKKGKTVILSWDSVYNRNKPTVFVIEGRSSVRAPYSLSSDAETNEGEEPADGDSKMSPWSYLASTVNTEWVILRSIHRGRWYKFRVGSVSKSGSYGYSQPTELFRLSSPPKPPTQPMNLSVSRVYEEKAANEADSSLQNSVSVDVTWLGSKRSDLPIVEYKLSWKVQSNELVTSDDQQKSSSKQGFVVINPDQLQNGNKYTIRHLLKNSVYSLQLSAVSNYEDRKLTSSPATTRLDTTNLTPLSGLLVSSSLVAGIADPFAVESTPSGDEEPAEEDYDIEDQEQSQPQQLPQPTSSGNNKQTIRNSNLEESIAAPLTRIEPDLEPSATSQPPQAVSSIHNITVQTPYFQNGLVKAKLSWQVGKPTTSSSLSNSDPTMYTLTWFPIKCHHSAAGARMPIPITASTIHTHFEIYELRYNCDYVINVRVAAAQDSVLQGLVGSSTVLPPQQIVSAQFHVPSCSTIGIVGRIRPICYDAAAQTTATAIVAAAVSNKYQKSFVNLLYSTSTPFVTGSSDEDDSTTTTTASSTSTSTSTTTPQLPRVLKIKYKLIDKIRNLYSVEFGWSLPHGFNRELFSGYQISVVPKEVPASGGGDLAASQQLNSNGAYFGSVGAIVSREQRTFVVRQLMSAVRYVFQIQSIGLDGQSYGPTSNLEFIIEDRTSTGNAIGNQASRGGGGGNQGRHKYGGRHDYEVINIDQNDNVRPGGDMAAVADDYSLLFMPSTSTASGGSSSLLTDQSTSSSAILCSSSAVVLVLTLFAQFILGSFLSNLRLL